MRRARDPKGGRGRFRRAETASLPAPVLGWQQRARINLALPGYAGIHRNMIPEDGASVTRNGYVEHATGIGSQVNTLMEYVSGTTAELWAAGDNGIYDVTSAGAVGAAAVSGLNDDKFIHVLFSTTGGNFLIACNQAGADATQTYDGTTWGTASITGPTGGSTAFNYVTSHKERLWFIERNSASAWYLPVRSVSGTATEFPMGALFDRGGSLLAVIPWSRDGGAGPDDYLVFITTEGEVAIYQGTDPATDFSLVGVYKANRPMDNRCLLKWGADVMVYTEAGPQQLSTLLSTPEPQAVVPQEIAPNFVDKTDPSLFGWQIVHYEKKGWLIFNVPLGGANFDQYVLNTTTQTPGWFAIGGWEARCWETFGGDLYFGTADGKVCHADQGGDDGGAPINYKLLLGWSLLGSNLKKHTREVRVEMLTTDETTPLLEVKVDLDRTQTDEAIDEFVGTGIDGTLTKQTYATGANQIGTEKSILWRLRGRDVRVEIYGFKLIYEVLEGN